MATANLFKKIYGQIREKHATVMAFIQVKKKKAGNVTIHKPASNYLCMGTWRLNLQKIISSI